MSDDRDGLREAVTKLRNEWIRRRGGSFWVTDELTAVLDAVPDVPPRPSEPSDGLSGDLASKSPTDPPAADVRARTLEDAADDMQDQRSFSDNRDPRQPWTWLRDRAASIRAGIHDESDRAVSERDRGTT